VRAEGVLSIYSADLHFESKSGSQIDLRSGSMVEAQHSAESLYALDGVRHRFGTIIGLDQSIIEPLMIPLPVIVGGVLASGLSQRSFAEEDHPIETVLYIYTADRHFESRNDAQIDLRSGAMVEAEHPAEPA